MANELGQHWLLLRGLARESGHWGEFVPQLQSQFPSSTVSTLDLPGTGQFHQQPCPASIPAITEQVRAHALAQGLLRQPVTILAVSLGAMVAWEWLQRYPEDSCGAVLMNTSFASLSPFYHRLRWQSLGKMCHLLTKQNVYQRELGVVRLVSNRPTGYEQIAKAWADIQIARPLSAQNALKQLIAAARYRPTQNRPKSPVLLLNGDNDRLVSPACSQAIQTHFELEKISHPWAGHDLTLDDGEWVITQLRQWLVNQA